MSGGLCTKYDEDTNRVHVNWTQASRVGYMEAVMCELNPKEIAGVNQAKEFRVEVFQAKETTYLEAESQADSKFGKSEMVCCGIGQSRRRNGYSKR